MGMSSTVWNRDCSYFAFFFFVDDRCDVSERDAVPGGSSVADVRSAAFNPVSSRALAPRRFITTAPTLRFLPLLTAPFFFSDFLSDDTI